MSLKDLILAADDLTFEDHQVPEWGGATVRVQAMTGTDRDAFEAKMVALKKGGQNDAKAVELRLTNFRSKVLVKCLHDPETGERVFEDNEAHKLGGKNAAVLDRLFDVAKRLSGMDEKAVEEAEGNSGTAPSGGSTSV
jgi:hypothetical protein